MKSSAVLIRSASEQDSGRLHRLAVLDSARDIDGPAVVAERDGRLVAAVSVDEGRAIADPFEPSAAIVRMLQVHRAELREAA